MGGTYHEGDVHNQSNRVTNKKSNAAGFVVLAVVALVVIGLLAKGISVLISHVQNGSLSASSTCQQFLNTDEGTEQQALVNIAMSKGIGGYGSPLALPEIRYECSSEPTMTLGALISHDGNEFG